MTSHPSAPRYPTILQAQVSHSHRFARALRTLEEEGPEPAENAAVLWLEGRAEEVEVFTADVLRAWSSGELVTNVAVRVIHNYLHTLHASLGGWYGQWYAPSCCGPLASAPPPSGVRRLLPDETRVGGTAPRRPDTLLDTLADAPAADVRAGDRGGAPVALAYGHAMASRDPVPRPARVG
jgi:hypothetical protein